MGTTLNTRLRVGQQIGQSIRALESDLDTALASAGRVMTAMAEGRMEMKLGACVGASAFQELAGAVSALVASRTAAVATHHSLAVARDDLRLPEKAFGDESQKVPPPFTHAVTPLHIAA